MTDPGRDPQVPSSAPIQEVRRALAGVEGRRRVDLILAQPDPGAVVRALPADELYFAIQDVGLADAQEIVQMASADQFRAFLDLDVWRGNEPDPFRMLPWLRAASGASRSSDSEERRWRQKLAALDTELVSLLLRSALRIHDLEDDPDPDIEGDRFLRTPEGRFIVEFLPEGVDYMAIRRLVDELYEQEPFRAARLLSAVRWELPSELEETALRWRTGRLADLGYPSMEEALSWFARPPPPSSPATSPPGPPARPPGFWLAARRRGTLLDRAAALLAPDRLARFEVDAMAGANATMVADQVDATDADAVRGAIDAARALLELGLESLSGGDDAAAAAVLASLSLKRIFQQGFGRLLELRWRARRLWQEGGAGTREAPLLDAPLAEAALAVDRRRPHYFPGLETQRDEWGSVASGVAAARAFRSLEEVHRTGAALADAEGLAALARKLGLAPPAGFRGHATLAALYLTALANERLGRTFAVTPIDRRELRGAADALRAIGDPRLAAEGAAGGLLATMARNRAAELAPLRDGEAVPPGAVTALLLQP